MILCVCKNVNSQQFQDCLQRGMSVEDISAAMGLGSECGCCLEYACRLAEQKQVQHQNTSPHPA